jgi:tetratricopeptide (TPR) repeat protein
VFVGSSLPAKGDILWTQRVPILLLACSQARQALSTASCEARWWLAFGCAFTYLAEEPTSSPPRLADPWDPAKGLLAAQATYAYRRTIALAPVAGEVSSALLTLKSDFHARGMTDAWEWSEALLKQSDTWAASPDAQPLRPLAFEEVSIPPAADKSTLAELIEDRLRQSRPLAAVELARQAEARAIALPWELSDRVAVAHLLLGEPAEARRCWERAQAPPSPALRLARIAQAELALTDVEAAEKKFRAALQLDAHLGEAWYGLALLELQLGDADATLAACMGGAACTLTDSQRLALDRFEIMAGQFASSGRSNW